MPNPPKPVERKRKTGNPGKRSLPKAGTVHLLPTNAAIPEPLRPLGQEGRRMWDRIWESGGTWVSAKTDIELVQMLCEALDERTQLRVQVLRGAEWRERVALRHLERSIQTMLSQLGFTPTDRTRIGAGEMAPTSKLEELKSRANRR